jgi:CYTH domain-containing protein
MKTALLALDKYAVSRQKNSCFLRMKSAAQYLENHVFEARRPRRELQAVVAYADAVQAVEQAVADAEKYRYLLMRALRHSGPETAAPAAASFFAGEATVLPLYPGQSRQAA